MGSELVEIWKVERPAWGRWGRRASDSPGGVGLAVAERRKHAEERCAGVGEEETASFK